MAMNMYERAFYEEVREKKIKGYGAFKMAGKGKKHKTFVSLPYDKLSRSARKKLNGEVRRFNVYQSLQPIEDFNRNPDHVQTLVMEKWREFHSNDDIMSALGIGKKAYFELIKKLGVGKKVKKENQLRMSKKNKIDMAAQLGTVEVLDYKTFKGLVEEQQAELLDEYKKRFGNQGDLAKAWGIATGTLYGLTGKLKKVEYDPTPKEKIIMAVKPKKVEPMKLDPKQADEQLSLVEEEEVAPDFVEKIEEEKAAEPNQFSYLWENIKELTDQVKKQSELIQSLQESQNKVVEKTIQAESSTPTEQKAEGFTMSYEKSSEGFMAHMDLKRFISVLEKNPDLFNVKISITRIEE